ncbi:MAG: HAD family hydrolase [Candidatus Desulforudis sp.]|nr:HAD family hydrolase [Desulforudis sp.]
MSYKYLLLDLDGTLLPMDMHEFLTAYLRAVSTRMAPYIAPDRFAKCLLASTQAMVENLDPRRTNADVFWDDFVGRTGLDQVEILPILERFYREEFPQLAPVTRPTPTARMVCTRAVEYGAELVIATNPIFPRMAIEERLRWAGIADFPFRLVTAYENMHFCKPQTHYYQQILDRLGAGPEQCLMAGNDPEEDLVAQDLGIRTYLVVDCLVSRPGGGFRRPDHRGRLTDLADFLAESVGRKKNAGAN